MSDMKTALTAAIKDFKLAESEAPRKSNMEMLFDYLRDHPSTTKEIDQANALPGIKHTSISSMLVQMYQRGLLSRAQNEDGINVYSTLARTYVPGTTPTSKKNHATGRYKSNVKHEAAVRREIEAQQREAAPTPTRSVINVNELSVVEAYRVWHELNKFFGERNGD